MSADVDSYPQAGHVVEPAWRGMTACHRMDCPLPFKATSIPL
jgi:hypothetical protein